MAQSVSVVGALAHTAVLGRSSSSHCDLGRSSRARAESHRLLYLQGVPEADVQDFVAKKIAGSTATVWLECTLVTQRSDIRSNNFESYSPNNPTGLRPDQIALSPPEVRSFLLVLLG